MKFSHIAICALLASPAYVLADLTPIRPIDIFIVDEKITTDDDMLNRLTVENQTSYTAIVKDGQEELTIQSSETLNMSTGFVAREGKTLIKDTHIISSTCSYPMLTVAGLNASLELNGATYQTSSMSVDTKTSDSSMVIGGRDGDGSLTLTNKSVLQNNHVLFAGLMSKPALSNITDAHNTGTYRSTGTNDTSLYRDKYWTTNAETGEKVYPNFSNQQVINSDSGDVLLSKATITVEGGSKLHMGTSMHFGGADIILRGQGSEITDGNQEIGEDYGGSIGDTRYGGTTLSVSDGASWTSRNDLYVSINGGIEDDGFNGDSIITVGEGGTFNSLRRTFFGFYSYGAKSDFTVQSGGVANVTYAFSGINNGYQDADKDDVATLTVEKGGQYNGSYLLLSHDSTLTNDGNVVLKDGMVVESKPFGGTETTTAEDGCLDIAGGTMINNGLLETEELFFYSGCLENAGSINLSETLALGSDSRIVFGIDELAELPVITLSEAAALIVESGALFEIVFSEASLQEVLNSGNRHLLLPLITREGVVNSEFFAALEGVSVMLSAEEGSSLSTESVFGTSVAAWSSDGNTAMVMIVPEPTTATLSLLALVGLAARRRRK